jgi:hypothetical protein
LLLFFFEVVPFLAAFCYEYFVLRKDLVGDLVDFVEDFAEDSRDLVGVVRGLVVDLVRDLVEDLVRDLVEDLLMDLVASFLESAVDLDLWLYWKLGSGTGTLVGAANAMAYTSS